MQTRFSLIAAIALALSGLSMTGSSSGADLASAKVVSVRPISMVRVRVAVRNKTSQALVVPSCGDRGGTPRLCSLATHLEVMSGAGWKPAETQKDGPILGGYPLGPGVTIKPGVEETFEWEFVRNLFVIGRSDRLRLLLDAWNDEAACKTEKPAQRIPTDPFVIPAVAE